MTTIRLRSLANLLPPASVEAVESRFAFRVAAHLTEQNTTLSADIVERLRFSREQALARARLARATQPARVGIDAAADVSGKWRLSRWIRRVASVLPVIALVAGLFTIQHVQDQHQIQVAAEVDTALLADDLPPQAYSDAGFVEFLKTPAGE